MNAPYPADRMIDRETSWLYFNGRVLQEAESPTVPLFERLAFCGIFSSNLDEYFRVRVASLRTLLRVGKEGNLGIDPEALLADIHRIVLDQQERYGEILASLMDELEREGIRLVDETEVPAEHAEWLREHFRAEVRPHLEPVVVREDEDYPFLENRVVYLVVELRSREGGHETHGLVEVPSPPLSRWVTLPDDDPVVMYLDDVIRFNLDELFPEHEVGDAFAVKLTRDAHLRLEDEFEGELVDAIRASLSKRDMGIPSRFLFDMGAPPTLVKELQKGLGLSREDTVIGGRYHNLSDLIQFPRFGRDDLSYPTWPPAPHPGLEAAGSVFTAVAERDRVVHLPYQSFDHVSRFLVEAANDPAVEEISLTVYRVAEDSEILTALEEAARAGKRVTVFVEAQARFDEQANIGWGDRLEAAGARTLYSIRGLKVHAKIALVARREAGERRLYAFVGTGNFNEITARVYADHGVMTADERLTRDVEQVFRFLADEIDEPRTEHLLVAPFTLREGFNELIEAEAQAARQGRPSGMTLKMNALEDPGIIARLYEAARDGVPIRLLVRGICRLVPGSAGNGTDIEVRSILDRYLEHARIYLFHGGGDEPMYLASADWMKRNLSRRVEVAMPVYDPDVYRQLRTLLDLQWADNCQARRLDGEGNNEYVTAAPGEERVRAQEAFREWLIGRVGAPS